MVKIWMKALAVLAVLAVPLNAFGGKSEDIKSAETESFQLKIGLAAGGPIGLQAPIKGLRTHTTERYTGMATLQIRFPKVSPRVLEFYTVIPNGIGINIKNDDFQFGELRLHLLDVGLFYNRWSPVSVQRVKRKIDLTFGSGMEYRFAKSWAVTLDWRMYVPANIFKVLTDYGDFSRLVGREAVQGGQSWLGVLHCW